MFNLFNFPQVFKNILFIPMVTEQLFHPQSIVVVGASNDIRKPGGKILKNLIDHAYKGDLRAINPKENEVQGVPSYPGADELPQTDMAILAIPASLCPGIVGTLAREKGTRAFIIISAGFSEESDQGAAYEQELVSIMEETGSCMIGPNCIGVITTQYAGCFTEPVPALDKMGVDFISGSGSVAVYVMESAMPNGLRFSSVFSVGNSAHLGVEDMLEYFDEHFDPQKSSRVKLLYLETIQKPQKLMKHAASLIRKGCRIAAIKAGYSEAGSRAASSHTGAIASADDATEALLRKAGIVRCHSRYELAALGGLFSYRPMEGKRMAIITHAGGSGVMLTDVLSDGGVEVPHLEGEVMDKLLTHLHPGSSIANPIDILATGREPQLEACIDCVENELDDIDGMCVIFGSPGLFSMDQVYDLLDQKIHSCRKPIYPLLPSTINAAGEVSRFLQKGNFNFPDEVIFGHALVRAVQTPKPADEAIQPEAFQPERIRAIISGSDPGYVSPDVIQQLLDAAGIKRVPERVTREINEAVSFAEEVGYPVVMKVVGPVHKSDVQGVVLNVKDASTISSEFTRLMNIQDAVGVLIQPMLSGTELFIGVNEEPRFGHLVYFGLGGIFIEAIKDVQFGLAPLTREEVSILIDKLKGRSVLEGIRGFSPVNQDHWLDMIVRVSHLVKTAPEIKEMDLNPVLGTPDHVIAVDARIRLEK